ncbi:helix-turn-helix transcriptional regulator [Psychromonas sp. MME2]|uniref:helix-turn-helix domain-containing protein n=1 Tax=unclassified Psychromonas TaxID=2614957 RepID=UPI00339C5BF0
MNNRQPIQLNAELLIKARKALGHNQETLSLQLTNSNIPVSRATINRIENGKKTEIQIAIKIAEALGVTLDYLQGKEEPTLHYWVQIYDEDTNGEFVPINKLGAVFENSFDLLDFIDKHVFLPASQYPTELPNIISSYYLDKTTNALLASVSYGESDNTEQFKIEVKLIKLTDAGLTWTNFTDFKYHWVEQSLKELFYKRSTYVNPLISTELIEHKYLIKIVQLPSKSEKNDVINLLSKDHSIDEVILFEKYQEAWKQLALSFIKYESIETNTFNELVRAIQLILNQYNPSKSITVQYNFKSNNNVQFDVFPNMQSDKTRGVRLNIYRVEINENSAANAPWPEYQMRAIENIWSIYADAPDNQLMSNVLSNETITEIKNCL